MDNKSLHFKTNVLLKNIIGKDLINDDNIAILELVKNSYDADSSYSQITFKNIKGNDDKLPKEGNYTSLTSRIIIQDNGIGMDQDDITEKWLNIAYSEKKGKEGHYGRILAGNKGVGRFSCDRLGEYLNLYSTKNGNVISHLYIDWKQFETESKDLQIQNIPIGYEELSREEFTVKTGFDIPAHGTLLEIIKLRSPWSAQDKGLWNKNKLLDLKRQLERLINPNQTFSKIGFQISLIVPEFEGEDQEQRASNQINGITGDHNIINGPITNKIFDDLTFRTTRISVHLDPPTGTITTELFDKNRTIFKLIEQSNKYEKLPDTKIILYFLNQYAKVYFKKQTGIRSIDFGSIYLFINGFRIPPYGDPYNDWLGLDTRKGQGYNRFLGSREIIGRIEVTDTNNTFQIISSREGVVYDMNFKLLIDNKFGLFYKTLKRLEKYVVDGIGWDRIPEKTIADADIEKLVSEGKFTEQDEVYEETEAVKNQRIYALINTIIASPPEDVINLYINEELILQKVQEEKEAAEREFNRLLEDITNNNISIDNIKKILVRKAEKDKELNKQLTDFSKYSTDEATSVAILQLQAFREANKKQQEKIEGLLQKIEQLEYEKQLAEEKAQQTATKAQEEAKKRAYAEQKAREEAENRQKAERERDIEREKNKYLVATKNISTDAEDIFHAILLSTTNITAKLEALKNKILDLQNPSHFLGDLDTIEFHLKKIQKLNEMLTKADIEILKTKTVVDIPTYIKEYLLSFNSLIKNIIIEPNILPKFTRLTSLLDLSVIMDNLVSNSKKAQADTVKIEFTLDGNKLNIDFSDNGAGVSETFISQPEAIFEPGITDRRGGSGIGLKTIKDILRKQLHGEIFFRGNGIALKGATFRIIL